MNNYRFLNNCVATPREDVETLTDMIEVAEDITREEFLRHVSAEDMRNLEASLGYEQEEADGLTMANDWHVTYAKSLWKGKTCYFFRHSAIEYYFTEDGPGAEKWRPHWADRRGRPMVWEGNSGEWA